MPEWVSAVVLVKPTFVAGPLVTSKFFRSVGSGDCLLIQVNFGGFDFSRFFSLVGALSLSSERV